ncbi:MAG TPA: hypothetical protein VFN09_08385 [Rhodanobacteraceae bacterium]|nr:hypothetical protein [Rhodanobacteraceae bacterium]
MSDDLQQRMEWLENQLRELTAAHAAARALAEANDDFVSGLWTALLDLLVQLRLHHPETLAALEPTWCALLARYEQRLDGSPSRDAEEPLSHQEARALLARYVWRAAEFRQSTTGDARHSPRRSRRRAGDDSSPPSIPRRGD